MPTGNPLEQLRRRMQSHATPAAFAALAEEHRRAGRLDEAIAVCRDGLARYPAYVSARVTLGRALLDTGDVAGALDELEQAVAQAPDNFAAVRALEAAHAAAGLAPPAGAAVAADLPLHGVSPDDTTAIPADLVARALGTGADGPQEFGLRPDWSLPEPPPLPIAQVVTGAADDQHAAEPETVVAFAHADAPTMYFTPPHLQGEEPAGIWPVPAAPAGEPITDAAPVFSWALDPPRDAEAGEDSARAVAPVVQPPASVWDAPTIDAPLVGLDAAPESEAEQQPVVTPDHGLATSAEVRPTEPPPAEEVSATADMDGHSGFWSDFGDVGTGAGDPVPFAGWGDMAAPADPQVPASPWGQDDATGAWLAQDGPSAAWALPGPDEVSTTPFQDVLDQDVVTPVPAGFAADEASGVDPVPFAAAAAPAVPDSPWTGSLASALDEVFARAGQLPVPREPVANEGSAVRLAMADAAVEAALTEGARAFEPPTSEITAVRLAMADVAVEAAMEDGSEIEATPALASLEQMLAAVRARRASLFSSLPS